MNLFFISLLVLGFSILVASVSFSEIRDISLLKHSQNGVFHVVSIITTTGFYTQDLQPMGLLFND